MTKLQKTRRSQANALAESSAYLFVYGTLMRGKKLHRYLIQNPGVSLLGTGHIQGELYRIRGQDYPGAIPSPKRNRAVQGEVYRISFPGESLKVLDELEGCNEGLFRRSLVDVRMNGKRIKAWTYFYAKPMGQTTPISNGRYLQR